MENVPTNLESDMNEKKTSPESPEIKEVAQDEGVTLLQEELELYKNKYLKLAADMENLRKRTTKEKQDARLYATEDLMSQIVPILDSFEQALRTKEITDIASFKQGVDLVYKLFISTLEMNGLQLIQKEGIPFNPNEHEAVNKEYGNVAEETVGKVLRTGYKLNGRLVRAAEVSVIEPSEEKQNPPEGTPENGKNDELTNEESENSSH